MKRAVVLPTLFFGLLFTCCGPHSSWETSFGESCAGVECADGSQCVENVRSNGEPYAACAIGGVTDEKCARDVDKTFCEGNTWIACRGRYRTQVEDCREKFCVEHGEQAKCVPTREPDPRCVENAEAPISKKSFGYCRDNAIINCIGPWARVPQECEGRFCRGVAGDVECRLQSEPDPRCQGRPPGDTSFCDGDIAVWCDGEWRDFESHCARFGGRCEEVLAAGPGKAPYAHCTQ